MSHTFSNWRIFTLPKDPLLPFKNAIQFSLDIPNFNPEEFEWWVSISLAHHAKREGREILIGEEIFGVVVTKIEPLKDGALLTLYHPNRNQKSIFSTGQ